MFCKCCSGDEDINNLDGVFGSSYMNSAAKAYIKNGLNRQNRKLIQPLRERVTASHPLTALEIGFGAGELHHELLRDGLLSHATGVDASTAGVEAASRNAETLKLADKVTYFAQDFAQNGEKHEAADVVILNKVICCYPHLQALLGQAAGKVDKYLVISHPQDVWWIRLAHRLIDGVLTLFRSKYHFFIHPQPDIDHIMTDAGLQPIHVETHTVWRMVTYERRKKVT